MKFNIYDKFLKSYLIIVLFYSNNIKIDLKSILDNGRILLNIIITNIYLIYFNIILLMI